MYCSTRYENGAQRVLFFNMRKILLKALCGTHRCRPALREKKHSILRCHHAYTHRRSRVFSIIPVQGTAGDAQQTLAVTVSAVVVQLEILKKSPPPAIGAITTGPRRWTALPRTHHGTGYRRQTRIRPVASRTELRSEDERINLTPSSARAEALSATCVALPACAPSPQLTHLPFFAGRVGTLPFLSSAIFLGS